MGEGGVIQSCSLEFKAMNTMGMLFGIAGRQYKKGGGDRCTLCALQTTTGYSLTAPAWNPPAGSFAAGGH